MNSEFTAKFEGIKLDDAAKKRIAVGLEELVIRELAHLDHRGDLVITRPLAIKPIINGIVAFEKEGKIQIGGL